MYRLFDPCLVNTLLTSPFAAVSELDVCASYFRASVTLLPFTRPDIDKSDFRLSVVWFSSLGRFVEAAGSVRADSVRLRFCPRERTAYELKVVSSSSAAPSSGILDAEVVADEASSALGSPVVPVRTGIKFT